MNITIHFNNSTPPVYNSSNNIFGPKSFGV